MAQLFARGWREDLNCYVCWRWDRRDTALPIHEAFPCRPAACVPAVRIGPPSLVSPDPYGALAGCSTRRALRRDGMRIIVGLAGLGGTAGPFAATVPGTRMPMAVTDHRRADTPVMSANNVSCNLTGYGSWAAAAVSCTGPETDPRPSTACAPPSPGMRRCRSMSATTAGTDRYPGTGWRSPRRTTRPAR